MSLIKSTATIGGYTLISRVLGFLRDVTIASGLGAGFLSDAFFVAFKLPNVLRRLFAEGAFNSAFVPLYSGMLAGDVEDEAHNFASESMSFLLLVLLVVAGIFIVIMPWLMFALAPGFEVNPEKYALTVTLTRITMPYIIFISLVSLLGGVLNSHHKFAAVAATPIIMNLCLIVIPFFVDPLLPNGAYGLAAAVMASGVMQWLWLVYFCRAAHMLPRWRRPRLTSHVKKLLTLIAPVAVGAGVAQINIFIDLSIASRFDGGNSYLYYADRINELPLAVIGIAVGTALLPMLSRQIREGKREEALHSQNRATLLALFLSLPAAAALMVIAGPVIATLYQRGKFDGGDTVATFHALMAFALGLPAFILIKILSPGFYARQDTKTPFKIAVVCIFINLFFNLALMVPLRHVGMALATSIAGWANVIMMAWVLKRRGWLAISGELLREGMRIVAASAAMALALYALSMQLPPAMMQFMRFVTLAGLVVAGMVSYFAVCAALDVMGCRAKIKAWRKA